MFNFLVIKYEMKSFFNWMVDLQCEHITQLIILSKTCFLYFIWIFSDKTLLKFNSSHTPSPKLKK